MRVRTTFFIMNEIDQKEFSAGVEKNVCRCRWGACAPFVRRRIINISYKNRLDDRHCPGYTRNNLIIPLNLDRRR